MKTSIYYLFFMCLLLFCCNRSNTKLESQVTPSDRFNMTQDHVSEFNWMNQPQSFAVENSTLKVSVNNGTDFFNNPEDGSIVGTAPFLYKEMEGDFVAKALVQPDFSSMWNAVAVMIHIDSLNWIKFAFENSDATGPGIVTVVTKGNSDDANGAILEKENMVWLAIVRKGNIYSMHWSLDGNNFMMSRLTAMKNHRLVKVGIEAQSPVGNLAIHQVHYFDIIEQTKEDLRNINE